MTWQVVQAEYELDDGAALVSPHAPRHWRHRHEVHGTGAFHQLHVRALSSAACHVSSCPRAVIVYTWHD